MTDKKFKLSDVKNDVIESYKKHLFNDMLTYASLTSVEALEVMYTDVINKIDVE